MLRFPTGRQRQDPSLPALPTRFENRAWGDDRGAVFLETLIVYTPLMLLFFMGFQLAEVSAAQLVVRRASSAAGRAAAVVLPDDPAFYDGEAPHLFEGQRRDDVYLATAMILSASPQLGRDFTVEMSDPPVADFGPIDVTVAATYHCGGLLLVCGVDGTLALTATTRHAYHRAEYDYDLLVGPSIELTTTGLTQTSGASERALPAQSPGEAHAECSCRPTAGRSGLHLLQISSPMQVLAAGPEDRVCLLRATNPRQVAEYEARETDPDLPRPTEADVIRQIANDGRSSDLVEFTSNPAIARQFSRSPGGSIVAVRIKHKYLTLGSGTEAGWVAYRAAPWSFVAVPEDTNIVIGCCASSGPSGPGRPPLPGGGRPPRPGGARPPRSAGGRPPLPGSV